MDLIVEVCDNFHIKYTSARIMKYLMIKKPQFICLNY